MVQVLPRPKSGRAIERHKDRPVPWPYGAHAAAGRAPWRRQAGICPCPAKESHPTGRWDRGWGVGGRAGLVLETDLNAPPPDAWHGPPERTLPRQRYFFTAEIAEDAENGELLWVLPWRSPIVLLPFPCFLTALRCYSAMLLCDATLRSSGPSLRSTRVAALRYAARVATQHGAVLCVLGGLCGEIPRCRTMPWRPCATPPRHFPPGRRKHWEWRPCARTLAAHGQPRSPTRQLGRPLRIVRVWCIFLKTCKTWPRRAGTEGGR